MQTAIATKTVFTGQGYDLQGFCGEIEFSKRTNCHDDLADPLVTSAQLRLYEILREDQLIWCGQVEWQAHANSAYKYVHTLQIDDRDVFAVISGWLWNHCIFGASDTSIPKHLTTDDCQRSEVAEREWLRRNLPVDPWKDLVLGNSLSAIQNDDDQVLLKWPFDRQLVVSVTPRGRPNLMQG
jgi:hypothetical protein